jgi:hypothetical protein
MTKPCKSIFPASFPYFEKIEISLCDYHAVCVSPPPRQLLNAWTNLYETWLCISWHLSPSQLHKSLPSGDVSVCVSFLSLLGNDFTRNNRRIVGRVIFYVVHVVAEESRPLLLPRTFCRFIWKELSVANHFPPKQPNILPSSFITFSVAHRSRNSSVSIATGCALDDRGSISGRAKFFSS